MLRAAAMTTSARGRRGGLKIRQGFLAALFAGNVTVPLPVNTIEALTLAGDGVVVPVVRRLAEHILEPILQASTQAAPIRRAIT